MKLTTFSELYVSFQQITEPKGGLGEPSNL